MRNVDVLTYVEVLPRQKRRENQRPYDETTRAVGLMWERFEDENCNAKGQSVSGKRYPLELYFLHSLKSSSNGPEPDRLIPFRRAWKHRR